MCITRDELIATVLRAKQARTACHKFIVWVMVYSNTCPYVSETRFHVVLASTQRLCRQHCTSMGTTLRQYKQTDKRANTTRFLCALSNGHQIVAPKEIPTRPW